MTELPIERDLREALDLDPSPQFAARVRQRIAEQPERIERRFGFWTGVSIAGGALALVALVMVLRPSRPDLHVSRESALASRSFGVDAGTLPRAAAASLVRVEPALTALARPAEPRRDAQVIISPSESRAILNLIAGIRAGRIDPLSLPAATPVVDLDIQPIIIAPLPAVDGGEGVRK